MAASHLFESVYLFTFFEQFLFNLQSSLSSNQKVPPLSNTAGTGHWSEGDPFTNVQSDRYWSSTTSADDPDFAWDVVMGHGYVSLVDKVEVLYVWPVRGGQ